MQPDGWIWHFRPVKAAAAVELAAIGLGVADEQVAAAAAVVYLSLLVQQRKSAVVVVVADLRRQLFEVVD